MQGLVTPIIKNLAINRVPVAPKAIKRTGPKGTNQHFEQLASRAGGLTQTKRYELVQGQAMH